MTMLDHALSLASRGFHVFPLQKNGKKPLAGGMASDRHPGPRGHPGAMG